MREFTGLADSSFSTFTRYRLTGYEPHIARTWDVSLRATAGGMTPCRIRLKKFRPAGIQVRQGRKPQLPCPQTQKRHSRTRCGSELAARREGIGDRGESAALEVWIDRWCAMPGSVWRLFPWQGAFVLAVPGHYGKRTRPAHACLHRKVFPAGQSILGQEFPS